MTAPSLPRYGERRGTLAYMVGPDMVAFDGWLAWSTDGARVIARRYRGRNRWAIASAADIVGFTPHDAPPPADRAAITRAAVEVTR